MKTNFIPIALFTAFAVSCSGPSAHEGHEGHDHGTAAEAGHEGHAPEAVSLDNGKRWTANAETTEGIAAMAALTASFDPAKGDSTVLVKELNAEFQEIFAKCTMTGEAHEQLHRFLEPVQGMLKEMETGVTIDQVEELHHYLATYGTYFQ